MSNEIAQLLELQSIDHRSTEASERIKRLQRDRARFENKVVESKQRFANQKEDLKQLEHDSLMKNLEVDELDANIRKYQHRLDTGIISFKEMEDLRVKIASERNRISEMEDEALRIMDAIVQGKEALSAAETALGERQAELQASITETDDRLEQTDESISELRGQRTALTDSMSEFLHSQYESLHKKFPDPIAAITNTTCSGCKLKLSGSTIERVRGSLGIVTCEHCSRILHIQQQSL
ncbi:MAG: C4-type zinc ribbon domain-containing protein [Candidatus Bipolaricaulota bacterium]